jgi:hypothetical protein
VFGRVDQPGMIAALASLRPRVQIPSRPQNFFSLKKQFLGISHGIKLDSGKLFSKHARNVQRAFLHSKALNMALRSILEL